MLNLLLNIDFLWWIVFTMMSELFKLVLKSLYFYHLFLEFHQFWILRNLLNSCYLNGSINSSLRWLLEVFFFKRRKLSSEKWIIKNFIVAKWHFLLICDSLRTLECLHKSFYIMLIAFFHLTEMVEETVTEDEGSNMC